MPGLLARRSEDVPLPSIEVAGDSFFIESDLCITCLIRPCLDDIFCELCKDAPCLSDSVPAMRIASYCSRECLDADRTRHAPVCEQLQRRVLIQRIANFLQDVWYTFKLNVFDYNVQTITYPTGNAHTSVIIENKDPALARGLSTNSQDREKTIHATFRAPKHCPARCQHGFARPIQDAYQHIDVAGVGHKALDVRRRRVMSALPVHRSNHDAVLFLEPLLLECLRDAPDVESIEIVGGEPRELRLQLVRENDNRKRYNAVAYAVQFAGGEKWVIDPCALQFESAYPYMHYSRWQRKYQAIEVEDQLREPRWRSPGADDDLMEWWQYWEKWDAACLFIQGLVPRLLSAYGPVWGRDQRQRHLHQMRAATIRGELANLFPRAYRQYYKQHGTRRRFDILRMYLAYNELDLLSHGRSVEAAAYSSAGVKPRLSMLVTCKTANLKRVDKPIITGLISSSRDTAVREFAESQDWPWLPKGLETRIYVPRDRPKSVGSTKNMEFQRALFEMGTTSHV